MTDDNFVSITDSAELAGVSKKTIERAYKKFMDHPDFGSMIEKRPHGTGFRYFVTKAFVDKCVSKQVTRQSNDKSVAGLVAQLAVKDRRIDKLTEMLEQKEQFSQALIRKGFNLPEGGTHADATDDASVVQEVEPSTTTPVVIAANVVANSTLERPPPATRPLFPTLGKGLASAGKLLRKDIF